MSKREEIEPHSGDKRDVRRDDQGQFKTEADEGRSLSADRPHKAMHETKPGQGDRGDRRASLKTVQRQVETPLKALGQGAWLASGYPFRHPN